jgi:hypothetical protein
MSTKSAENGQVLVIFAFMLAAIFGLTALVIDVGLAFEEKADLQSRVDAAALAGASALPDADEAEELADEWATRNGLSEDVELTYNTPYNGDAEKIEVIAEVEQPFLFARVLGKESVKITVRAVGEVSRKSGIDAAFLALSPTLCRSFDKSGSSDLDINGPGGIMVNSSCDEAINRTGGGDVEAAAINYYEEGGWVQTGSGSLSPLPTAVSAPLSDPLAFLQPPDLVTLGQSPDSGGSAASPDLKTLNAGTVTLHPGVYYGGLDIRSSANVTFASGTYVMAGGGFKISGSGTITGDSMTLYNTYDPQQPSGAGACGSIDIGGSAVVKISAPTSGEYKSIGIWQDNACTNEISIAGGQGGATGVIYAPSARVKFVGSGNLGSIQAIADSFNIAGTGDLVVNFVPFIDIPLDAGLRLTE